MKTRSRDRWLLFWKSVAVRGDSAPPYEDLVKRYSEPQRAYHTLEHIEHCLEELDAARPLAQDAGAVEMAIWYHDAVYDPRKPNNEERSARLARKVASRMGMRAFRREKVVRMILASRHRKVPTDADSQLFTDIDLSILGQSRRRFVEYEGQIRREYEWVPEPIFKAKRASLLRSFLDRPTLYSTLFFRKRYETRARENLAKSLK
jgi:predicted metal-dependent HD superfamily phosphohydrolase